MRFVLAIFGGLLVQLAAASCGGGGKTTRTVQTGSTVADDGAALYAKYCALCHAENGRGYAADNANALAEQGFLATADDNFLWVAIDRGRPGTPMAAYGDRYGGPLSSSDINKLIGHLRSWQQLPAIDVKHDRVEGDPGQGKLIFEEHCAHCHGDEGQGSTAISVNNPLFLATASDGFIRYAIEKGREGTEMPAFVDELSAEQIDHVTRYVRSFARTIEDVPIKGELPPTFERVVINPDGPAPKFPALREGRYVAAKDVHEALAGGARMVLLDARPTSDWLKSHIPGALPVPYYEPDKVIDALPRDGTWILSYCGCPHAASGRVMDTLRDAGFKNTAVIDEGVFVWMARGYPITHGARP